MNAKILQSFLTTGLCLKLDSYISNAWGCMTKIQLVFIFSKVKLTPQKLKYTGKQSFVNCHFIFHLLLRETA